MSDDGVGINDKVAIFDTTLRDGEQSPGISLDVGEKLEIAEQLARLGVDYLEAGFPSSNPKERELFAALEREDMRSMKVAAFGMTRRRDTTPDTDDGLRGLAECFAPVATVVGKTWDLHVLEVLRTTLPENLRMIADSVCHLHGQAREVVYDAEHFFDGLVANREYALATLQALKEAGRPIGLISDCSPEVPLLWDETPLAEFIADPVLSCAVGLRKPDARIYLLACERLGVDPYRAVFVGDGDSNEIQGAADVGLCPILVDRGETSAFRVSESDHCGIVVHDLTQVLPLIGLETVEAG